ncbi:MAG: Obg family GTPase CgtA [Parcubacteria group bacterium]
MLTDEAKIKIQAGKGGDGIVAFDKVMMSLGPTGGRGGNGGSIYFEGVSDIFALNKYRHMKEHYAPDGKDGRGNRSDGPNGKDLVLTVPVGTLLVNVANGRTQEITSVGQKILAAKGGIGGRGNFFFRSGSSTSPTKFELGKPGEGFDLSIELRLIADVGLIGLPSAGKSSLLNELTAANAKVAAYHFTTLEPNLGVMDDIILADIPGLIEGASAGRGLGIKFLRHIQRTKALLHCISLESEDLDRDYKIIRQELASYDPDLVKKKELVILTKNDLVTEKELKKRRRELKTKSEIVSVSIHNLEELEALRKKILALL